MFLNYKLVDHQSIFGPRFEGILVVYLHCKNNNKFFFLIMACIRSDTPLIYKAVPGWFIQVESLVDKLLANNKQSYW